MTGTKGYSIERDKIMLLIDIPPISTNIRLLFDYFSHDILIYIPLIPIWVDIKNCKKPTPEIESAESGFRHQGIVSMF
jgi:hypothetical protein